MVGADTSFSRKRKAVRKNGVVKRRKFSMARQIGAAGGDSRPELKDVAGLQALTSAAATTWSPLSFIAGIATGTSAGQRVGRKTLLKSLLVRWNTSYASANSARLMVVYDHSPNGVLPLITDILNINSLNGINNLDNSDRFIILKDFYLNTQIPDGQLFKAESFFLKWPEGLQQVWTAAGTGTIADCTTGALYIMACGGVAVTVNTTTRVRYTDV